MRFSLRFEHPEMPSSCRRSRAHFLPGANVMMLRGSSHVAKVNFCKFTNETRLAIGCDAHSGLSSWRPRDLRRWRLRLALASRRHSAGGRRNSAVSLPEAPLLGVLPGTGRLTRIVDSRVRRDRADFSARWSRA
jgi:benzoyl-CoA-dihydrodiol lyase